MDRNLGGLVNYVSDVATTRKARAEVSTGLALVVDSES